MITLTFDLETTGIYNKKLPLTHDSQPWPVSIATLLSEGTSVKNLHYQLVNCSNEIPEAAIGIHGITNEDRTHFGQRFLSSYSLLQTAVLNCDYIVGYNIGFDINVILSSLVRYGSCENIFHKPIHDIMHYMTPICKLPGPYGYKWPKLKEAFSHVFPDAPPPTFHNALDDVLATHKLYLHLLEQNQLQLPTGNLNPQTLNPFPS